MNNLSNINSIKTFLLLLVILTGLVQWPGSILMDGNLHSLLLMWVPGIAAIISSLIARKSIRGFGWGFSGKWILIGWFLPLMYGLMAYGVIWLIGLGDLPSDTFLERARFTLGMESGNDMLIIISAFFYITVINLIPNMFMTLGEEIGWRGYLVPELSRQFSFGKTAVISGMIWGGWHLPAILSGHYGPEAIPIWFKLACFGIMVIATATILAWIRLKSGSLWPAVAFHAVHNGAIQMFFDRITIDTGNTQYFAGEFGIALALSTGLFALLFLRNSNRLKTAV